MKTCALAAALLLGTASFTSVADSGTSTLPLGFDWSGAYIGANLGYAWSKSDFEDEEYNGIPPFPKVNWDVDDHGFLGGLQAGYNWQRGNIVYGLEGELGYLDLDKKRFPPGVDPILNYVYDAAGTVDGDWYLGLAARLGYASERTLYYGKVGAVYSRAKLGLKDTCSVTPPCGNTVANDSDRVDWGYQIGAGLEHALNDDWTLRAEYTYFDFGDTNISGVGIDGVGGGVPYKIDADLSVHALKLGINYRFK
ncbi:MAG TPA: outer membrane protein [Methylophilaceae bacterium]